MQIVQIIGNIVADAECRTSNNGVEFLSFRVAVNENRGEEKSTQFYNVYSQRTSVHKYLLKGREVYVMGNLKLGLTTYNGKTYVDAAISCKEIKILRSPSQV